jgi:hypothetical protein
MGKITRKTESGEVPPLDFDKVVSLADAPHFEYNYDIDLTLTETGAYMLTAPLTYPLNGPPYECRLPVDLLFSSKTYKFENLYGGEILTHDFVFKSKSRMQYPVFTDIIGCLLQEYYFLISQ